MNKEELRLSRLVWCNYLREKLIINRSMNKGIMKTLYQLGVYGDE